MIEVAVALIKDEQGRLLITQRPQHVPHGGFWEFPGGKLETGECATSALIREIKEEVDLDILSFERLDTVSHQYADKHVQLHVFIVNKFSGIPCCKEGQPAMRWILKEDLQSQEFPEANHKIIRLLSNSGCSF